MAGSHPDRARDIADWGDALIRAFGETNTPSKAAFILPDGRLVKYHYTTHSLMAAAVAPPEANCGGYSDEGKTGCMRALITRTGAVKVHDWGVAVEGSGFDPEGELIVVLPRFRRVTKPQAKHLSKFLSARRPEALTTVTLLGDHGQGSRHCTIEPTMPGRRKVAFLKCLRENDIVPPSAGFDGVKLRSRRSR